MRQLAQNTTWNIQVIRSDNLNKSGQAAVNGQIADLKADMAKIGVTVNLTSDSTRSNIDLKHIDPTSFDKGATPYFFVTSQEAGSSTSACGKFGKTVGVVVNEFANSGDKVVLFVALSRQCQWVGYFFSLPHAHA